MARMCEGRNRSRVPQWSPSREGADPFEGSAVDATIARTHAVQVCSAALALALILAGATSAVAAGVWKRTRSDGTEEFTNVKQASKDWRRVREPAPGARHGPAPGRGRWGPGPLVGRRRHHLGPRERRRHGRVHQPAPGGGALEGAVPDRPGQGGGAARALRSRASARHLAVRFSRYEQHIRDQQAFFGIPQP
jgi:hypothetical protein